MADSQHYSTDVDVAGVVESTTNVPVKATKAKRKTGYRRSDFYRQARALHAWLSAFAFLVLMFFALTGLLLNHPEWFNANKQLEEVQIQLLPDQLAAVQSLENPTDQLLQMIRAENAVVGRLKSSEMLDDEVMIRLESPAGHTDIQVLMSSGNIVVATEQATTVGMLNDLHRGKEVGSGWRWLIDVSAVVILLLSLAGYVLFFSLKTRKATSLWLTASSVVLIAGLGWLSI